MQAPSWMATLSNLLPWIGLVLALAGLYLLLTAHFKRRRGDEPRCKACDYNLTGIESERCPECGAWLSDVGAVVTGRRVLRPRRAVSGLLALILGVAPLGHAAYRYLSQVDWYGLKPTSWVLRDLASTNGKLAAKAAKELRQRLTKDKLSPVEHDRAAEVCLAEQVAPAFRRDATKDLLDLLSDLY